MRHLLLFTGSHDQSPATIRALVRSVAQQLHSLSLDYTAYEHLFPSLETDSVEPPSFPELRCYGTYWDAAYHALVGLPIAFPPPSAASKSAGVITGNVSRSDRPSRNAVPFLHTALYPAQLESLAAALESVLTNPELKAAHVWAGVEQWRIEGTLRDLDQTEDELDQEVEDEDEESIEGDGGAEDAPQEEEDFDATSPQSTPARRLRPHYSRTEALVQIARHEAKLDLRIEPAASSDDDAAELASQSLETHGLPATERIQRATFERGFGTSWWRFVDDVEQGRL